MFTADAAHQVVNLWDLGVDLVTRQPVPGRDRGEPGGSTRRPPAGRERREIDADSGRRGGEHREIMTVAPPLKIQPILFVRLGGRVGDGAARIGGGVMRELLERRDGHQRDGDRDW
jgi:hypothetical protein